MKLSLIVPVYDEAATVSAALGALLALPLDKELVIVESGSADGSAERVDAYRLRPGVTIVHEDRARGKGAAVRRGLALVCGDVVAVHDADLEYSASEYPRLLEPIARGEADVVLGSRALGPAGWRYRARAGLDFGAMAATKLFNARHGTRLSDGATMFKLFKRSSLEGLRPLGDHFEYDWEMLAHCARRKARFAELPVAYTPRVEGKKIRLWRDAPRVLSAIIRG